MQVNLLYIESRGGDSLGIVMDIFWSIFAMPIGVTICFAPAIIIWWLTKGSEKPSGNGENKH